MVAAESDDERERRARRNAELEQADNAQSSEEDEEKTGDSGRKKHKKHSRQSKGADGSSQAKSKSRRGEEKEREELRKQSARMLREQDGLRLSYTAPAKLSLLSINTAVAGVPTALSSGLRFSLTFMRSNSLILHRESNTKSRVMKLFPESVLSQKPSLAQATACSSASPVILPR
jgi:hypothetical protein